MSTPGTTAISASGVRLNQVAFAMLLGLTVAAGAPALADSVDPSLVPPDVVLSPAATQPAAQSPGSASTAGQSGQSVSTSSYSLPAQSSNSSGKPWNAMQASEMGDLSGPDPLPTIGAVDANGGQQQGGGGSSTTQAGITRAVQTQAPY